MRLPVRTALLQNSISLLVDGSLCDYQSERHCSKTVGCDASWVSWCDYQSERHCSKTHSYKWKSLNSAITSQNGTAPKPLWRLCGALCVRLPVRTALLQNGMIALLVTGAVRLPVRTALLQNIVTFLLSWWSVRLPVRTALLQNRPAVPAEELMVRLPVRTALLQNSLSWPLFVQLCDYQSERHCSKTRAG